MTTRTTLSTPAGDLRVAKCTPQWGAPPWPALVLCMDGLGLRASLEQMAQRIADEANVVVVVPDLFYKSGDVYDLLPKGTEKTPSSVWPLLGGDPAFRATWRAKFFDVATKTENVEAAFAAVLASLDADKDVDAAAGIGVTGYCMGGHISMKAAGLFPTKIKAAASFHGGFLATDAPDSPHALAQKAKARFYVAAATDDASFPEPMKQKLVDAFTAAKVEFVVETYPARHGWCVPDSPSFNEAEANKAQKKLTQLLRESLRR